LSRVVEPVSGYRDEVLRDFETPPTACVAGADFLIEELEQNNPDLDERCGLLNDRYEVYAVRLPDCRSYVLVVSLDTSLVQPWPCTLHGLLPSDIRPCDVGRQRAAIHLNLINPSWEPANV
jgi:hypothetical protein